MHFINSILDFLNAHWLLLSFCAPMLWAIVNIIDVYFVKEVYDDEMDGTIMSGLFQIIPWVGLIFFLRWNNFGTLFSDFKGFNIIPDPLIVYALVGGFLFVSSFYFYFKALFNHADAALVQIIWSLTVVIVPLVTFLIGAEKLPIIKYVGMAVVLVGAILLSLSNKIRNKFSLRYILLMLAAVGLLSFSMVFENSAYTAVVDHNLGEQGFLFIFALFSLGAFLAGIFFAILAWRNPVILIKKYWKVFLIAEGISFVGTLASQRSIDIAPSVSYVAAVETFVPVFIMIFSLIILLYWSKIAKVRNNIVENIYHEQLDGVWIKIIATIVMGFGVYLIS